MLKKKGILKFKVKAFRGGSRVQKPFPLIYGIFMDEGISFWMGRKGEHKGAQCSTEGKKEESQGGNFNSRPETSGLINLQKIIYTLG